MKHVFTSREVPHIWAQQSQEDGRNAQGNFYFEGATIYSYGKHFPIATMEGNDVLFTLRSYSNTTARQVRRTMGAISHKNIIWCYEPPVKYYNNKQPLNKQSFTVTHETNLNYWKNEINAMVKELGNKKNRDIQGRVNVISRNVAQLTAYCTYFSLPIKDKELKSLLSIVNAPDFIEQAREAKAKQDAANERKMKQATKAYETYLGYWREFNTNALLHLPEKIKGLAEYYMGRSEAFTRLRYNTEQKRVETSKGVQIPVEIAKRAYTTLNGCMEGKCDSLNIDVMNYTITKTTDKAIIAGCHTIPKEDVRYIADLLKW